MSLKDLGLGLIVAVTLIAGSWAQAADKAPAAAAETTVIRDRFSDEIVGTGPDLVFIPGLASSRDTWKATAERLKAHYRLHLIQLAGFAGEPSRGNAGSDVLVPTAEALDAYLVEQHLTPATVIGHSMGGTMALYLAEHHPDHLKKAMLVDALPFFAVLMAGPTATAESMKPMADAMRAGTSKMSAEQSDRMMATMVTAPADLAMVKEWGAASDRSVVMHATADDITLDLRPGLAKIVTPITLLHPDYASLGSPAGATHGMYAGAYASAPTVKVVEIGPSLHFIMLDQPEKFATALDTFLAE